MRTNTGGPAFPAMHFDLTENEHGMTLRDYFAAKAMQSLMVGQKASSLYGGAHMAISMLAYQQADAMLKAREP
jgi:hypothetical protein